VLLAERTKPPYDGVWSLPGGHVEEGETLKEAALRELREETGIGAALDEPFDTVEVRAERADGERVHYLIYIFAGSWVEGEAKAASDVRAVRWTSLWEIRDLAMTPGTAAVIERAAALAGHA